MHPGCVLDVIPFWSVSLRLLGLRPVQCLTDFGCRTRLVTSRTTMSLRRQFLRASVSISPEASVIMRLRG